ncbi:hypothetical protein L211DRAFT_851713 [Terfezia boudieri ATCC MYA-4762]|uniref:Uncharacterized protein n=1 Tax=Terfezia boudieri ATCC MYA-4762 TaxID=1051890 RepID=A0A3N4LEI0_9PEZI|nr:hypothetical protein L211DRAFT_851713 [Terfezia boudieri ATCC MYA-4762]
MPAGLVYLFAAGTVSNPRNEKQLTEILTQQQIRALQCTRWIGIPGIVLGQGSSHDPTLKPSNRLTAKEKEGLQAHLSKVSLHKNTPEMMCYPALFYFYFLKYSLLLFNPSKGTMRSPPETREDSEEGKLICQLHRARKIRVKVNKTQDPHAVINSDDPGRPD